MKIDGIILAAGLSTRMKENKLRLLFRDRPILRHVIDLAAGLPLHSRILVTRQETIAGMDIPETFQVVINPWPEEGQSLSLRLGLEQARGDGYLFFLGDQPLLDTATVTFLLAHARDDCIVVPVHAGRQGNPVFFPARFKSELLAVSGDRGGRGVIDRHQDACRYVQVQTPAPLWDVDTRDQYEMLLKGTFPK